MSGDMGREGKGKQVLFQLQIKALSSLARQRLLNVLIVRLRCLLPRRLDVIFDLKPELHYVQVAYSRSGDAVASL